MFTCSSSQVEKPRPVAFTRAVQEHSWLPGWQRACYPPTPSSACASSFHIPSSHTPSICILFASTSPLCFSWPPCNKETSSAFFIFLAKTQVKTSSTASSPGGVCVKQKLPDPENQMLSHQTKSAAPAVPETSCW